MLNQSGKYYFDNPDMWEKLRLSSIDKEIDFIHHMFSTHHKVENVLDIGCGSGIHCERLEVLGYTAYGIDLNPTMVEFAKKNHPRGRYFKGDMRKLKKIRFPVNFDGIICLCTTFCYNTTNEEVSSVLSDINSLMVKDGIMILEVFNPISFLEKIHFEGSFFLENQETYKKSDLKVEVAHSVDERKQTVQEIKRIYDLNNGKLLKTDHTVFRMYFPQELCFFLNQAGFEVLGQYGRYDINYLQLDRTRLITMAKKIG